MANLAVWIWPQKIIINPAFILTALLLIFSILGIIAIIYAIRSIRSAKHVSRTRAIGLRSKLALLTIALILLIIFMVSAPLYHLMKEDARLLQKTIFIVAIVAGSIGAVGALILASFTIMPIRRLVRHAEIIRDTKNRENLASLEISVTSRDEIAVLGDTINDMTKGLAKAAVTASELSAGREIQKKFLPLNLENISRKDTRNAAFFGYYEGAGEISGDYFDYHNLDGRYYSIIKCDVAGKGIPAALIMIQVATMFVNYFKHWEFTGRIQIEELAYQINGFIETMGFHDRFAAFTLCLFDTRTGALHFCNAGDNIIHIFDHSKKRVRAISLPQTPAAGVLSNKMIEATCGYEVHTLKLNHGDILLLYTDGIEDSKRRFHGIMGRHHAVQQHGEELGPQRMDDIINAVMNRKTYCLTGRSLTGDFTFDFSHCSGVEDLIMALIAVEKIFRCYRDSRTTGNDCVLVDKKVDTFLKSHFLQYPVYCSNTREYAINSSYMYYTYLREDEQYDDLTILGIRRK